MMKKLLLLPLLFAISFINAQDPFANKLSFQLRQKLKRNVHDSTDVSISINNIQNIHAIKEIRLISMRSFEKLIIARIKMDDIPGLIASGDIIFINEIHQAKEELTTGAYDLSLNRVNYVQARIPFINGAGLNSSVKERLFDTTDIDLRGRTFITGLEAAVQTSHASLMATMIAGGANSSPFAKGIAWRSNITSSSFQNLFPDPDSIFQQRAISVQNHSYGTIVESFYGNEAFSYDKQSNQMPWLLHVFSSGNAGTTSGTSGAYSGLQYANLTGNFKQAKNILTVGSVDSAGQIMPLSSKGPAYDGRIKPELVAYGEDGSSGAAAIVSGVALLLQHAYKNVHSNLPASSLIKAVLLNSADDISNPHPDYFSGFGNLNAYRALNTIKEGRYFENTVSNSDTKLFSIEVPSGISRLKVSLVWNDPASVPNAPKSLVNDLDLQLKNNITNETWLPWVLDHSANLMALQSPAQRKKDTLNNVEQVTIDNPAAGVYSIEVKGSKVTSNAQSFSLAWQVDTSNVLYWTYPAFSDPLIASNIHWLRWETNLQGPAQIEYATNGNNWRQVGSVNDAGIKYFRWRLPDTVTTAVLRIVHASGIAVSDSFTISPQPSMKVGFNCADSFLLYWNDISPQYEVYELGHQYLQVLTQTNDTSLILNKSQHPALYYSVAPIINGKPGIRSNTINYPALGPACYINAFYLQSQTPTTATFTIELGTLFGIADISLEKLTASGYVVQQSVSDPQDLVFNITDDSLSQGENHYRIKLRLDNGTEIFSDIEVVYHWTVKPVVVYPNPVIQNSLLNVIANESGRYTLQVIDNNGKIVFEQLLVSTRTEIRTSFFPRGLYVIRIMDRDGKPFSQKMIVY